MVIILDLLIKNGTIVTPERSYKANVFIKDGKIIEISENYLVEDVEYIIDAKDKHIFSGFIDTHIHSRDRSDLNKEDFYHSTMAAAAGGITTVLEMPNSIPAITNVLALNEQINNLTPKAHVDFGIWGLCLGDLNNDDLLELAEAGVVGFKFFWGYAIDKKTYQLIYNIPSEGDDFIPPLKDGEVYKIFKKVKETNKQIAIHAENASIISELKDNAQNTNNAQNDYDRFLSSRPAVAEESTIVTAIAMARDLKCKLHILHITSKAGVDAVRVAQKSGVEITSETCPHYLFLDNSNYENIGSVMKVYPPIRFKEDQDSLWEAIKDGIITHVCSDHAPHTKEEKIGDIFSIPAGMCGVETLAPLMINAVNNGKISENELSSILSEKPSKLYNLYPEKGSLKIGTDADITIVDFKKEYEITEDSLHSKSKVTAFNNYKVIGKPYATIVRGNIVMEDGEITSKQIGKFIRV